MYSNKRPRGEDWGYPGGGSWGRDHMYGGTDQAARDYGGGAAGGGGIMPANGSAGAGMMAGGMAGGMSSGMGGSMAGGGGMMGQGGGIGMMSGLGMAGAGMMQQGGRGGGMAGGGPMMGGSGAMVAMNNSMGGMGSMGGAGMGNMGSMGGAGMGGGMMGGGGGMMPQHGGGGGSMMGHDGGAFPAVKLRGLPFGVHEEEVRAFLGCELVVDVLLTRKGGRPSGEAYVVLGAAYQVEAALQRNRSYLGRRYVEVFKTHKQEYYLAVTQHTLESGDASPQQQYGGGGRGMYDGRPSALNILTRGDDRRHGDDDQRRDQEQRHRAPPQQQAPVVGDQPAQHTGMLKLRGLPFSATKAEIMEWFTDLPVAPISPDGVRIVINPDGRPSGMAFVEFASPDDAATAMSKDRNMLGNRYVELFPSNRDEANMDGRR